VKILHVVQRYPPAIGGGESWCAGVARWQASAGHEVHVLCLRAVRDDDLWGDGPLEPGATAVGRADSEDGVTIERCAVARPAHRSTARLLARAGLPTFARTHSTEFYGVLVRRARAAHCVHAHAVPGPHVFAAWLAARLARRPYVLTPHFHAGDSEHEAPALRWLLRHADRVVPITAAEVDGLQARGVARDRITCASNAFSPSTGRPPVWSRDAVRAALAVPAGAPLLCCIGRKASTKGLDVLLRALPAIRHRPAPVLALAGPGTGWFRDLLRSTPSDHVRNLAPLPEDAKQALLAAADVVVLPSRFEAFGSVILESWAAGSPVIGADVPTVREVLGDAGVTFRAGDDLDLAARIDELLDAPETGRRLIERGRARLPLHTWDRVGAAVMAAYVTARAGAESARALAAPRSTTCR